MRKVDEEPWPHVYIYMQRRNFHQQVVSFRWISEIHDVFKDCFIILYLFVNIMNDFIRSIFLCYTFNFSSIRYYID